MTKNFLARFKPTKDSHQLFSQLSNSKMEVNEPIREFVPRFNHLVTHLSHTLNSSLEILLRSFINALASEIAFFLRSANETELMTAQENAIEIDDKMITSSKMKIDSIRPLVQSYADPLLQKIDNEMTILKKHLHTQGQPALPALPPPPYQPG